MIWRRYLLSRLLSTFLFIFSCAFFLYVLVDLAVHSGKFFLNGLLPDRETVLYYLYQLSNQLTFFFSFSFLLSLLHVLLDLNIHNELAALQLGGLSLKKLLTPFFLFGAVLFALNLANSEWIAPFAQEKAALFVESHTKEKKQKIREHVHTLALDTGIELIYQSFNKEKKELFDVFWIISPSEIWHAKTLEINEKGAIGRYIDRFSKSPFVQKTDSFETLSFPDLRIDPEEAFKPFIPFERRPLSELAAQIWNQTGERHSLLAHCLHKLSQSLLLLFIPLAVSPTACRFARFKSPFLIFALSLFFCLSLLTILDGILILAENQVLPASATFLAPLALISVNIYHTFRSKKL